MSNCHLANLARCKQVRTNNDAAFLCNFLFNIFFNFIDNLFPLNCTIDFKLISHDFAIDFAMFTIWLQMYGRTDGQTHGQNNGQTDKMGKQTNEPMDMQYICIDMQETIIFQWILQFLQKHYGRTDGPTDRRTDGRTNLFIEMPCIKIEGNFCLFSRIFNGILVNGNRWCKIVRLLPFAFAY